MYQVLIKDGPKGDEVEIHSPFSNSLKLIKADVKKGISSFDSFNLIFLPDNPAFGKMKPLTTLIRVVDTQLNNNIFKGRVLIPTDQMESNGEFNCSYTCASDLSYLQDSVQKYTKIQDTTPEQFFKYLIDIHNSQVEEHKRFVVGVVTITNNTDNVYRYVDDMATTWGTIQDKLINRLGGELKIREVNGLNYIDYVVEIGEKTNGTIELSKNLVSVVKSVDPTNVVTRIYPRGARVEVEEGNEVDVSQPRLTISSVNGGKDYLDASQELINEFGIISQAIEWSDVNQPQILKSKGQQFLNEQKPARTQYSLSAVDLSLINMDIRRFEVGNFYFIRNPIMGIDEELRIVGIGIDIIDIETSELIIGDKFITLSQYQAEQNKRNAALNDLTSTTKSLVDKTNTLSNGLTESNLLISAQQKQLDEAFDRIKELENNAIPFPPIIEQKIIADLPKKPLTSKRFIVAHETGNPNNVGPDSLNNEVSNVTTNWKENESFVTHYVGGGGRIIQTAETGVESWGCGPMGNSSSLAQVELCRTDNEASFKKDYRAYIWLLRKLATDYGIRLVCDDGGFGIKTHKWISDTYHETDHQDPIEYLRSFGISYEQFKTDIAVGLEGGK